MKITFLFIIISVLASCSSENHQSANKLSDFIKPTYSHNQSVLNCELLPDKNLNSVEKFIPLFVDDLNEALNKDDQVMFLFPIQDENTNISKFKILLNHKDEDMLNAMRVILANLSFEETASCNTEDFAYGRLSLRPSNSTSTIAAVEMMECKYLDGFNYATMKLVFEEFIDELTKVDQNVSIVYAENLSDSSNFRWFNIFESTESRKMFVEGWQDLSVSNRMQALFLEQSSCGYSNLYKSYKVV